LYPAINEPSERGGRAGQEKPELCRIALGKKTIAWK
jgi:hypothetical protein